MKWNKPPGADANKIRSTMKENAKEYGDNNDEVTPVLTSHTEVKLTVCSSCWGIGKMGKVNYSLISKSHI